MNRYILGLLAIIGLFIILIILAIPSGKKTPSQQSLISYASTDAVTRLTINGPVQAVSLAQSIQINVSRDNVTFEQLTGYSGQVVKLQTYPNTEAAYDVFLHALYYAGFNTGNNSKSLADERGICPLGDSYIFELVNNDSDVGRFWATNCGGVKTYNGAVQLTITLFQKQVPDYSTLVQNINI